MNLPILHGWGDIPIWDLILKKSNYGSRWLYCLLTALLVLPGFANAQHTLSFPNSGNDYQIQIDFSGFNTDRCKCEETRSLKGYAGGYRNGTAIYTANNLGTSGSLILIKGPGFSQTYYFTAHYDGVTHNDGCTCTVAAGLCPAVTCHEFTDFTSNAPSTLSTASIKNPTNVSATNGTYDSYVDIAWAKGSNIPDQYLDYKVYRDGTLLATIPASSPLTYRDTQMSYGVAHTYRVTTFTNDWGNQESSGINVTGSTFTVGTVATDGEFHNRVKLTWNDVSAKGPEEIRIERSTPAGGKEEIAVVSKNAVSYSDYDAIPGYNYTYTITPLAVGKTFIASTNTGYRKPNGIIKGTVKSKLNAGVPGITVTVTVKTSGLTAGASTYGASSVYTTTTDSSGVYEISGIYYYTEAEFYVTPTKTNHVITPTKLTKKLDLNSPSISGVDFTDETVFTVAGKITFPSPYNTCVIRGVDIYLNGRVTGVKTDSQGKYALAIQEEGIYTLAPKFFHHAFDDPNTTGTNASRTITVAGDALNQDFVDLQTDTLFVKVKGGCDNSLANFATIKISSTDPSNCLTITPNTNASGILQQVLPAQAYKVQVTALSPANANIMNAFEDQFVDLTVRDTLTKIVEKDTVYTITPASTHTFSDGHTETTPADTTGFTIQKDTVKTVVKPKADFIYRGELTINIHNLPDLVCNNLILERGDKLVLRIEVLETHGNITCPVDSGTVTIYDKVGDRGVVRYPIVNGEVFYTMTVGEPNLAATGPLAYKKLFEVFAEVGNRTKSEVRQIVVTGVKPLTATYTSRTPELPFLVVHDPPGDGSFSFLAKDSTVTTSYSGQIGYGGEAGGFLNLKVGAGTVIPFIGKLGANLLVNFAANAGRDNVKTDSYSSTFTATQQFSTASGENFVGNEGDVVIGASMNVIYTLAKEVRWNANTCSASIKSTILWDPTDFATTYVYTEKHIKKTLLPQLKTLYDISVANKDTAQIVPLNSAISVWNQVLTKNKANRDKAKFVENKSFSSGAAFDNTITSTKDTTESYEYTAFVNLDLLIGGEIDGGDFNETSFGAVAKFRWNKTENNETVKTKSTTIGYHLEDDDVGDFFSVDIGEDPVYGTPTFKTKAGTSSCPHEDNTQARFTPQIDLTYNSVSNVPANGTATFTALITNLSESGEAREYEITTVSATNPDGANITLGGQQINQDPVSYYIPYGVTLPVTLTVNRGPLSSTYQDLQIMMYPACEYELWRAGGVLHDADTVTFSAYFQSECSVVSLREPGNNWLVKQSNNNQLHVVFTNYDASNDKLVNVELEYRQADGDWQTAVTIPKASLSNQFYDYFFNVTGLPDGRYEIRAKANCSSGAGFTYSDVLSGIIDRATIAPFGTPTPSDGFLRPGQKISVLFDKTLKPLANYPGEQIKLTRIDANGDTITIPSVATIVNNQELLIKTNPDALINSPSLRGVELTASVGSIQDANGNVQKYPVVWSFRVEKPVFWDPDTLLASVMVGSEMKISSALKNSSETNKRFTLTKYPAWLTPSTLKGVILPTGFYNVDFTISNDLKPGVYSDVVEADIEGVKEVLLVNLELLAVPVSWKVDPAAYGYSMNIVAQFSLTDANAPLSTDPRDVVGVFVNGVARGVGKIQYVSSQNKYAAFLTVYSNEPLANKETLTFRMWKALTGVEYGAKEKTAFVIDGNLGSITAPYILHPEGIFQVIPLKKGWNWISLNVTNADMSREKIFSSLLASGNKLTVKNQTTFTDFNPASGWSGTLTTLNLTNSYMVFLSDKPDTLRIAGTNPATFAPIALAGVATGTWNWIGYPRLKSANVGVALATFPAKNNDVLKNPYAFATFTSTPAPGSWIGSLKTMDPGLGYKLKLTAPASLTYPANGRRATDGSDFEVKEQAYEYNMTMTGVLKVNQSDALDDHYTVAAFVDGSCRGFAQPEFVPELNAYRLFLVVHGDAQDAGEAITFKVFDTNSSQEYIVKGKPLVFNVDERVGDVKLPYALNWNEAELSDGYYLSQNRPNPATHTTVIDYTIPQEEMVKLTLVNQVGVEVKVLVDEKQAAGNHRATLNGAQFPSGVYLYTLKAGKFVKTRKMVIIR